jgi:HK97 family phage portal protein
MFNPFKQRQSQPDLQVTAPPTFALANEAGLQVPANPTVEQRSSDDPWDWMLGLVGPSSIAGPEVSPATALEVPAVRNAVDLISGLLGTLPLNIYRPSANGGTEIVNDHPALLLIRDDANPWTGAPDFRTALTLDSLLWGSGFGLVLRDSEGQPRELHRLPPPNVVTVVDPFTQEPHYTCNIGQGGTGEYGWQDIIQVRPIVRLDALATAGWQTGLAPIKTGRQAIGLALAMEHHAARLMNAGGRPSGVLSFAGKLGNETAKKIKASWTAATSGRNSGGTAVLEEGGKFQPLAFSSVDNQFLELRQFQILEIARLFGVPPMFLQELGRATFANFEQSSREFTKFTLLPWCRTWEAALRRTLLSDADRRAGLTFGYDLDGLLEGDLTARASAYSTMIASRILNPNEARAKEGMAAYKGGEQFANPNTTATPAPVPPAGKNGGAGG